MSAVATTIAATPARRVWQTSPLGKVVTFLGGGTPSKQRDDFWGGEIPWVSPKDMKADVVAGSMDNITPAAVAGSAVKLIPAGALLIVVRSGILARTIPTALAGATLTINQDLKALVPSAALDAHFLAYFMRSIESRLLEQVSRGATVHRLETGALRSLAIPLPPLEEQKRIVAVLDQAFAALDRARANAEANLADAMELKERSIEHELSSGRLGRLEKVGPYVDLLTGFAFKSGGYSDAPDDIRLIRGDNIVQGEFRWDGVRRWPVRDRRVYSKYELALDDVLIAMDRTWVSAGIKYVIVDECALPSLLVQRVARLRAKPSIVPRYLAYWIGSKIFERYVLSIQTGLGVPHVSGKQIENFSIRVPANKDQAAVVDRLDAIVERCGGLISTYRRKLADLAALRQSLLQKAFAGELT